MAPKFPHSITFLVALSATFVFVSPVRAEMQWEPWKTIYGDQWGGIDVSISRGKFDYGGGARKHNFRFPTHGFAEPVKFTVRVRCTDAGGKYKNYETTNEVKPGAIAQSAGDYTIAKSIDGYDVVLGKGSRGPGPIAPVAKKELDKAAMEKGEARLQEFLRVSEKNSGDFLDPLAKMSERFHEMLHIKGVREAAEAVKSSKIIGTVLTNLSFAADLIMIGNARTEAEFVEAVTTTHKNLLSTAVADVAGTGAFLLVAPVAPPAAPLVAFGTFLYGKALTEVFYKANYQEEMALRARAYWWAHLAPPATTAPARPVP